MARTNVPIQDLLPSVGQTSSPTTADATNGHNIPFAGNDRYAIIRLSNTAGTSKNATFKAGAYPPGNRSGIGDLVVAVGSGAIVNINIEQSRFVQTDGSVNLDLATGFTGTVEAIRCLRGGIGT